MYRLTILGAVHPDAMALLQARPDVDVTVVAEALAPRNQIEDAVAGAHAINVRTARIDAPLLETCPDLKIVSRHASGATASMSNGCPPMACRSQSRSAATIGRSPNTASA